tara:strand:- start:9613 stop:11361 length:1749 start_codon:yes stop_codon:yes gene_type:complete
MLEKQKHILSLDDLFEDEQIGTFVRSIQIDSPYQQLIFEGVLTETIKEDRVMVTFTVEGYFHYVLGEVVEQQTKSKDASVLIELLENNQLRGIVEGIEQCLIRDVEKDDLSRLMWLIDEGGECMNLSIFPLVHAFTKFDTKFIFDGLLQNPTKNDFTILNYAMDDLSDCNKHEINKELAVLIISKLKNNINSIEKANLLLKSVLILYPQLPNQYDLIIQRLINFASQEKSTLLYYLLGKKLALLREHEIAIPLLKKGVKVDPYANNLIGLSYHYLSRYKYALRYFYKYHKYTIETNDLSGEIFYNMSTSHFALGEIEKALKLTKKAIDIEERNLGNYDASFATTLIGYGQMLFEQNERLNKTDAFEKAQPVLLKALKIVENTRSYDDPVRFDVLFSLASNYMDVKKIDLSIEYYQKAQEIFSDKVDKELNRNPECFLMVQYAEKGWLLEEKGRIDEAIVFYKHSIEIGEKLNLPNNIALVQISLGKIYEERKRYKEAIELLQKATKSGYYKNEPYDWNPSFWLGKSYYQLGFKQYNNKSNEYLKSFKLAIKYLKPWRNKMGNEDWNNYVNSILNNLIKKPKN